MVDRPPAEGAGPSVSVVVPVRNRRDLLRRALDALDVQTHRDFEVIVVDDGSTDGAGDEAVARPIAGRPVRVLQGEGRGAVSARRLAVAASTADVLAFTDSDCEPDPTWLAAGLARVAGGAELVHGQTLPARRVLPLERSVTEKAHGLFPTCNLVVTRRTYDAVGGFDPDAGSRWRFRASARAQGLGFGEDTIFGWTVARRYPTQYAPEMVVRHHVFPADLREWVGRSWQMGAFPALFREAPELRSTLVRRRVFFGSRVREPLYATAIAIALRRPALVALAAGWWVLSRYRQTLRPTGWPLPQQLRALPPQLLLDVVQAAALLTGSVRARTLLL